MPTVRKGLFAPGVYSDKDRERDEYKAKLSFDLKAGQEEIDAIDRQLAQLRPMSRREAANRGQLSQWAETRQQVEDLQRQRSEKNAYLNQARLLQENHRLSQVGNPDSDAYDKAFEKLSQYAAPKDADTRKDIWRKYGTGYDDLTYEYINGADNGMRREILSRSAMESTWNGIPDTDKWTVYDQMTEDEIGIYNYYYAKEGKAKAKKYLDSIQESLNYRKASGMYTDIENKWALEMLMATAAGVDQFGQGVKNVVNTQADYLPQSSMQMLSGMMREDLADVGPQLPGWLGGGSLGQAAYDTITTTVNMTPSILSSIAANAILPGSGAFVGNATMFASAAGSAYQEALNLGYDKAQARLYSTLVGGSEVGLQAVLGGISALGGTGKMVRNVLNGIDSGLLRVAGKLVASGLSEGLEEGLQEALTPAFKQMALRLDEDVDWGQVAYSALLGALTAGLLEGPNTIAEDRSASKAGRQFLDSGVDLDRLKNLGSTMSADSAAYKLAGKVNENSSAYAIGKLFQEVGASLTKQNQADIQRSLEAKGFTPRQARTNARAFAMVVEGASLTPKQRAAIEGNELLSQAVVEEIINPNSTVNQRTQNYNEMLMDMARKQSTAAPAKASETAPVSSPDTNAEPAKAAPSKVQSVVSTEGGKLTFQMADGTTAAAEDVELGDMAPIYETIAEMGVTSSEANILAQDYAPNTAFTSTEYAAQMRNAYRMGEYGIPMKQAKISSAVNFLSDLQLEHAYNMGRAAAQARTEKAQAAVKQRTVKNNHRAAGEYLDVSELTSAATDERVTQIEAIAPIAEALQIHIKLYASEEVDGKRTTPNGRYDPATDTIYLDINAGLDGQGTMLFTLAHELTHRIKAWSPAKFKILADFLMEEYGKKGAIVEELINNQLAKAQRTYKDQNLSQEQLYDIAYEEFVADSMEPMLADGKVLEKLRIKDESIWNQLKDYIQEFAEKIRKAYASLKPDSREGQIVLEMKNSIETLEKLFLEGLEDSAQAAAAAQKNTAQQGGETVRYSMPDSEIESIQGIGRKSVNAFTSSEIQKTEALAKRYWTEMGTKSPFFRAWFGDWRAYDTSEVQVATQKGSSRGRQKNLDTGWDINVSGKVFQELKAHQSSPVKTAVDYAGYLNDIIRKAILLDSYSLGEGKKKSSNSLLIHSLYAVADIGNGPVLLKLYVEEMNNPNTATTAKRAYQLKNIERQQSGVKGSGDSPSLITQTADIKSVADLFAAVKARDKNFLPKSVSKAVLNNDGSPKVFYHGTRSENGEFWEFDYSKAKKRGGLGLKAMGKGNYFTSKKLSGTERYGSRVLPVYLNISNPFEYAGTQGSIFEQFSEITGISENGYDNLQVAMKSSGYDGVVQYMRDGEVGVAVTFDSTQSKSATDNVGTFDRNNPDIRYSERDPGLRRVNAVTQAENIMLKEDLPLAEQLFRILDIYEKNGIFTQGSVEAAAKQLMKRWEVKSGSRELTALLMDGYQNLAGMKNITLDDVQTQLGPVVDWLMEHRKQYLDPMAQDLLSEIRTTRIYLDKEQRGEAAYKYGSYQEYRRAAFGKVILTDKNATSLDQMWTDWSERFPSIFPPDTTSTNMPEAFLEGLNRLRTITTDMTLGIDMIGAEQDLLRDVYDTMFQAAVYPAAPGKLLPYHDRQIQDLKAEHRKELQALTEQHQRKMETLRNYHAAEIRGLKKDFQEKQEWRKVSREKTELRHSIQRTVKRLNSMLTRETKNRHIPEVLKLAVLDALDAVNMDTVTAEARLLKLRAELEASSDPDVREEIEKRIATVTEIGGRLDAKLESLEKAYSAIRGSMDPTLEYAFDEEVYNQIQRVKKLVGKTALRDMSKVQLEAVNELYTVVMTRVRDMNNAFATARQESIDELGKNVIREELSLPQKDKRLTMTAPLRAFFWNNEKPVYAFERIGSETLTELFRNVRKGEDVYAQDMEEAKAFQSEMARRFGVKNWDMEKTWEFTDRTGKKFDLNLGQMLTLYAYSKREQSWDHLQKGGFQFDPGTKLLEKKGKFFEVSWDWESAKTFKVDELIMSDIIGKLTEEQRAFADRMQGYLSDTMGGKGNEISMKLYGIRLFKEKHYFPLKSSRAFLEQERNKANGEVKIKNKGFTKGTVPHANNPVFLQDFLTVWDTHVSEMSMYHGFTLPLEDFYRVRNYKEGIAEDENADMPEDSRSVVSSIQGAHGKAAVNYVEQLLKDLNGGVVGDSRAQLGKGLVSKHKKAAVMASLSVVIQQPTSLYRAMALVDSKYFLPEGVGDMPLIRTANAKKHKQLWAEVKQYAPVAVIKEMGSFDTNVGRGAKEYLSSPEYEGIKERAQALLKDENYRDEMLGKAAALADEMAWVSIWQAVKKETADRNRGLLTSNPERFYKIAGERFTEVITKTQVYDSVLARSSNMRSKDAYMGMAMSFMAEPTTVANMVEEGIRKFRKGDKKSAGKVFRAVLASHLMNSLLVSVIYAMRDDDEDETFTEKYVSRVATELLEGLNPITYIPFAKDIWSIFQGYDVERADMTLFSDLAAAVLARGKLLNQDTSDMNDAERLDYEQKVNAANWALVDILSSITGFPVKNIRRDINGILNTFRTFSRGQTTTQKSLWDEVLSEVQASLPGGKEASKQDKLYNAILAGDSIYVQRLKAGYKSETSYNQAVRKAIRENDPRIRQAALARSSGNLKEYSSIAKAFLAEKNFTQDDFVAAVNAEINAMNKGESSSAAAKAKSLYTSDDLKSALISGSSMTKDIREELIRIDQLNGKTKEEAEKSFISTARDASKEAFLDGSLSRTKTEKALVDYCGRTQEEAKADVEYWAFKRDYPDIYADDSWFDKYYQEVADSGMDIGTYMNYRNQVKDITGEGKQERRWAVIDSLPISKDQKDTLHFAEGWAESSLYKSPWH